MAVTCFSTLCLPFLVLMWLPRNPALSTHRQWPSHCLPMCNVLSRLPQKLTRERKGSFLDFSSGQDTSWLPSQSSRPPVGLVAGIIPHHQYLSPERRHLEFWQSVTFYHHHSDHQDNHQAEAFHHHPRPAQRPFVLRFNYQQNQQLSPQCARRDNKLGLSTISNHRSSSLRPKRSPRRQKTADGPQQGPLLA